MELTLSTAQVDFPIVRKEDGALVGLLTEADLLKGLRAEGRRPAVSRYMRGSFPTAAPEEPLFSAQVRMAEQRVRAMPIVDKNGRLVGLLSAADVNEAYRLLSAEPKLAPAAR